MGLHAGTHCDAPSHVKKNGKCISDYPIETWLGWAKIVNISHCKKKIIGRQDIVPYKHKFEGQDCICLLDKPLTARLDKAAIMEISSWGPKAVIFKNGANFEYIEDTLGFLECDIPMIMEVDKEKIREVQDDDFIVALPIKFEATEAAIIRLVAIRGLYRR